MDALAAAVSHWEDLLCTDVDLIIQKNQENERQKIVKTWLNDKRRMGLWSNSVWSASQGQPNRSYDNNKRLWNKSSRRW